MNNDQQIPPLPEPGPMFAIFKNNRSVDIACAIFGAVSVLLVVFVLVLTSVAR